MTVRIEQEKTDRLAELMGWRLAASPIRPDDVKEKFVGESWIDPTGCHRCAYSWNPFQSHDACVPMLAEIERRGLWRLFLWQFHCRPCGVVESFVFDHTRTPAEKADAGLRALEADEQRRKEK